MSTGAVARGRCSRPALFLLLASPRLLAPALRLALLALRLVHDAGGDLFLAALVAPFPLDGLEDLLVLPFPLRSLHPFRRHALLLSNVPTRAGRRDPRPSEVAGR